MSIYLDLIEQFSERIIKQLFLISSSGEANHSFQDNSQKIIENLKGILVRLKYEKSENWAIFFRIDHWGYNKAEN